MGYRTIKKEARDKFIEKKSTFIGHIKRVQNEEEAKNFINKIKSEHREARHNVYAYVIGENLGIQRYSDDGEPQGTGGIPVLEVIKKAEITDACVVVTRYFGGILLGAGGLTRAYTKGAAIAIKASGIVEKVSASRVIIEIEYDLLGKLQYLIEQKGWFLEGIDYGERVILKIIGEEETNRVIMEEVSSLSKGKAKCIVEDYRLYFKDEGKYLEDILL